MNENIYIFTGRVIPERTLVSISEFRGKVNASEDVPEGDLYVEVIMSQISVRFVASGKVRNIFTLRNTVEDAVRIFLDAAGYSRGYGYDAEIVQVVVANTGEKHVFGIDVPALAGICEQVGITVNDIFTAVLKTDGHYLRHALANVREAIKSPIDTGFFCYRAIETLKNCCAFRNAASTEGTTAWELFRNTYSVSKEDILYIKGIADPVRHGNYLQVKPVTDEDRKKVFVSTWEIINKFILKEKASATQQPRATEVR